MSRRFAHDPEPHIGRRERLAEELPPSFRAPPSRILSNVRFSNFAAFCFHPQALVYAFKQPTAARRDTSSGGTGYAHARAALQEAGLASPGGTLIGDCPAHDSSVHDPSNAKCTKPKRTVYTNTDGPNPVPVPVPRLGSGDSNLDASPPTPLGAATPVGPDAPGQQEQAYVRVRTDSKAAEKVYLVGGEMADESGTASVTIVTSGTDFRVKPMWVDPRHTPPQSFVWLGIGLRGVSVQRDYSRNNWGGNTLGNRITRHV